MCPLTLLAVPGDAPGLRSLRQIGTQMRIPKLPGYSASALHAAVLSTSPHREREHLDARGPVPVSELRIPHARHPRHGRLRPDEHGPEPPRLRHGAPHQGHRGHQEVSGRAGPAAGTTSEHANALVATCFALTFQSVTLEDGMAEYMTFIRGILIVGTLMWIKGIKPIFVNVMGEDSSAVLEPRMADLPLIRREWADGAVEAIGGLRGLCRDVVEVEYFELIMAMATKLHTSSWEAYQTLTKHYGWWIQLPHEKFQRVIDTGNQTMILLASHWIALKQIMAFITNAEHECREKAPPPKEESAADPGTIRWLGYLNKQVDHEHLIYNRWPVWVEARLKQDLGFFGKRC
ncbi:uncharacterized protein GLRG_07365 [Colletotrichum graminicola M1.001]|uniref:C6 zinc finger protein n=1 Tax=Colletotrichum graminicola (strain M1.001 / M2 / FGSC 10212) TaxID=645133 RepID=E3QMY3_COLGM|nr:uncharacterized protein GLRG_07365 [Colletotrichum graminicola M1.001]EFQ32221.1 hypothetical protein GLRG_07365 [Colletotrichum graminicola M1.001]